MMKSKIQWSAKSSLKQYVTYLPLALILSLFMATGLGCKFGGSGGDNFGSTNLPTSGGGGSGGSGGGGAPASGDPTENANYFYVRLNSTDGTVGYTHKTSGFSDSCRISRLASTNEDITCYIDIPEGELYAKDIELLYNIPASADGTSMCRYLRREPYWFYNQEVGNGPTAIAVSVDVTINASGDSTYAYTCSYNGGAAAPCASGAEVNFSVSNNSPNFRCVYDRNGENNNVDEYVYKNCCFGNYALDVATITSQDGTQTTVQTPRQYKSWGTAADMKSCLGGPGRTNWNYYASSGRPIPEIVYSATGINTSYKIDSGLGKTLGSNIHSANNYLPSLHSHTGFVSASTTTMPYFVNPIDDRNGTLISRGNPAYTFSCLNEAFEVNHRISVYIRDWDTYPDYLNYISSSGATEVPDRGLSTEPGGCVVLNSEDCNDYYDNDDFLNLYLQPLIGMASYDMSLPAVDTNRPLYFPRVPYQ